MYSPGESGETECSRASAGRWKRRRQSGPWMRCRRGRMRRGLFGGEELVDEDEDEEAVVEAREAEEDVDSVR
jgi:hypothetical protein